MSSIYFGIFDSFLSYYILDTVKTSQLERARVYLLTTKRVRFVQKTRQVETRKKLKSHGNPNFKNE